MNYLRYSFTVQPLLPGRDILIYELGELGFDSFEETPEGLHAYIPEPAPDTKQIEALAEQYKEAFTFSYTTEAIAERNWNAEWEAHFQPIEVSSECIICAPFHTLDKPYRLRLLIQPQMSFGTGHHETTWLMARKMLDIPLSGKTVLDMGCGTGILAILARKLGAAATTAIDIDEWSYRNTLENIELNDTSGILVEKGDAQLLPGRSFQVILANINRNVLLADLPVYAEALETEGILLLSGIFTTDIPLITEKAQSLGLSLAGQHEKNNWALLGFKK